jgi:uncharacterized protein with HEPN domain
MTSRDEAAVAQILDRCRLIREFSAVGWAGFLASREKQEAIVRCFEVMGEAARRVSPETKRAWPKVPWQDLADLRNHLIHEYEDIVPSVVWDSVERLVPKVERLAARVRL